MFYMFFLIFITLMSFLRLFSVFMHMKWRSDLYGEYPTACGDWAVDNGCTRVQLEGEGCVRAKDIVTENSVIFEDLTDENELNSAISDCIENKDSWKIMSPDNLDSLQSFAPVVHITIGSAFFGFLDDLYIQSQTYRSAPSDEFYHRKLRIQSQLRIGRSDFDKNYDHVKSVLDCLNKAFDNTSTTPAPCSK